MGGFMSCVVVCGAVEVVHLVHSDGHVERLIRPMEESNKRVTSNVCSSLHSHSQLALGDEAAKYKYRRLSSFSLYKSALFRSRQQVDKRAKQAEERRSESKELLLIDSQPFKVKQEGGVTKLVVSKKYLAQLLSESKVKKRCSSSTNQQQQALSDPQQSGAPPVPNSTKHQQSSSRDRGRYSVWRPALESISEAHLHQSTSQQQEGVVDRSILIDA